MNEFGSPTPILNVKSVPSSITYYVEKLGFKKKLGLGHATHIRIRLAR